MLDKSLIGRESEPAVHEVERGAIRRFAEAIGDPNPIYVEEEAARQAGHSTVVAPPTFPFVLTVNERFRHSLDLGTRSLL
ncbi:MAG: MaoC family dehydratase N-terminal domain-containing protein, partial [Anaeromyxobacteraceae bacterium]